MEKLIESGANAGIWNSTAKKMRYNFQMNLYGMWIYYDCAATLVALELVLSSVEEETGEKFKLFLQKWVARGTNMRLENVSCLF